MSEKKPKIEIGEPYYREDAICVPTRLTFPDGTIQEATMNWNKLTDADEIERQLKGIWDHRWKLLKKKRDEKDLKGTMFLDTVAKLKGKKIHSITGLEEKLQ